MNFKEPDMQIQFNSAPKKLQEIALYFCQLSEDLGIDPTVTRVVDGVDGDSGVHEAHRGIDFRDQLGDQSLYSPEQINSITSAINNMYPRTDGHLVCMHHSFENGPFHFHIQIGYDWLTDEEKRSF